MVQLKIKYHLHKLHLQEQHKQVHLQQEEFRLDNLQIYLILQLLEQLQYQEEPQYLVIKAYKEHQEEVHQELQAELPLLEYLNLQEYLGKPS